MNQKGRKKYSVKPKEFYLGRVCYIKDMAHKS